MIYLLDDYKIKDLIVTQDDISINMQDENCTFLINKNAVVEVDTKSETLKSISKKLKDKLLKEKEDYRASWKTSEDIIAENKLEKKELKETIENMKIVIADLLAGDDTTAEKSAILEEASEIKVARDKPTSTKKI